MTPLGLFTAGGDFPGPPHSSQMATAGWAARAFGSTNFAINA